MARRSAPPPSPPSMIRKEGIRRGWRGAAQQVARQHPDRRHAAAPQPVARPPRHQRAGDADRAGRRDRLHLLDVASRHVLDRLEAGLVAEQRVQQVDRAIDLHQLAQPEAVEDPAAEIPVAEEQRRAPARPHLGHHLAPRDHGIDQPVAQHADGELRPHVGGVDAVVRDLLDLKQHVGRLQRIAADLEEVVVHADVAERQAVDDMHVARPLERREPVEDEVDQLGGADRRSRAQHHRRADILTQPRVRHGEGRDLAYRRVGEQGALDVVGRDLLVAAIDDLLGAADDRQVAVGIDRADIAGGEPARLQASRLALDVARQVARYHAGPAQQDRARLAGARRPGRLPASAPGRSSCRPRTGRRIRPPASPAGVAPRSAPRRAGRARSTARSAGLRRPTRAVDRAGDRTRPGERPATR